MALDKNPSAQDDEVSGLIDKLYSELMTLRFEYINLHRKGKKDLDDLLDKITNLNEDFESLIKAHTLYIKFKKATGHGKATHSEEMLKKIQEIESNVGQIISAIPKVNE